MSKEASIAAVIIDCERNADAHRTDADACQWEAAKLISGELAAGKTGEQVAAEIGQSPQHVRLMARAWELFGGQQKRPPFDAAYQEAHVH